MLKPKFTLTLLAFFAFVFSGHATIHIWGNTTVGNIGIADDIIIHSSGVFTVQNGGLQMTAGKSITVEDGGQFRGINGYITGSGSQWEGIIVDWTTIANPATTQAVYLNNFTIADAKTAVNSGNSGTFPPGPGYHNRKMYFYNSTFENNQSHLTVSNSVDPQNAFQEMDQFIHSTVYASNCTFGPATGMWPIHILYTHRTTFADCEFTGNTGSGNTTSLHFRALYKGVITRCTFNEERGYYVSLHGWNKDNRFTGNTFNLYSTGSSHRIGFESGYFMGGIQENTLVDGNTFIGDDQDAIGIHFTSTGNKTTECRGLTVTNNTFESLDIAAGFSEISGDDNRIEANEFSDCKNGLNFRKTNENVFIECNSFTNSAPDILIESSSTLENQDNYYDPGNTWSITVGKKKNIRNDGTTNFVYHFKTIQPTTFGPVSFLQVLDIKDCEGGSSERGASTTKLNPEATASTRISMYPNPARETVTYELNGADINEVVVMSITGEIVLSENVQNTLTGKFDVSQLAPGIYICNYINDAGIQHQEKLIIAE